MKMKVSPNNFLIMKNKNYTNIYISSLNENNHDKTSQRSVKKLIIKIHLKAKSLAIVQN